MKINVKATLTNSETADCPLVALYCERTGITPDDIEPSANSSLNRLGTLNATKKESDSPLAPKNRATIMSLTNPSKRLIVVAAVMERADLAMALFSVTFLWRSHFSGETDRVFQGPPGVFNGQAIFEKPKREGSKYRPQHINEVDVIQFKGI